MQITGMLYGSKLLEFVDFPSAEVLGPDASEEAIKAMIERHGSVFVKTGLQGRRRQEGQGRPVWPGEGPQGARWPRRNASTLPSTATATSLPRPTGELRRRGAGRARDLLLASVSTEFRAPTLTITHRGGMDIEEVDEKHIARVPFDALTGMKAFVVANALADIGAPPRSSRRWCSNRPLWELFFS